MPPQFIKDCSLQWLVQISVNSVPGIISECSPEGSSCWISDIFILCICQALQALACKCSALVDPLLDKAFIERVQVLLTEMNLCSVVLQRKTPQGSQTVFSSLYLQQELSCSLYFLKICPLYVPRGWNQWFEICIHIICCLPHPYALSPRARGKDAVRLNH